MKKMVTADKISLFGFSFCAVWRTLLVERLIGAPAFAKSYKHCTLIKPISLRKLDWFRQVFGGKDPGSREVRNFEKCVIVKAGS